MSITEVTAENTKIRIDSGYFSKEAITTERLVESLPNHPFSDITSVFRKGIFDIKAETYVETNEGIPFVRIGDLRGGLIQKNSTAWISKDAHRLESKTALKYGDLVVSKTAYPAASMVNLEECNVSQDTIAVRLKPFGREQFKSGFIAAFLNAKQGYSLMARRFQGNVQQHLSLEDGKLIKIPLFGLALQNRVHENVEDAGYQQDASSKKQKEAEGILLAALGLADWTPPEPLSYTARASDAFAAGRLDAQYFSSKFDELLERLSASAARMETIRNIRSYNARGLQPEYVPEGSVYVVNSRHILEARIDYEGLERTTTEWLKSNERAQLQSGDILTYTTGAKIGRTAHFALSDPAVASNHVNILRLSKGNPEYVAFVMNSLVGRLQTEQHLSGTAQPELYPGNIDKFVIPFIPDGIQSSITANLRESEESRAQARQLLETARRAVEIAIENGEATAMAFLNQAEGANSASRVRF